MKTSILAAALFLGLSFGAQAAIVEQDFASAGDGLLMLDTTSGRQWVDVTHTANLSINGFFADSQFANKGFQLANAADVTQFFLNAGAGTVLRGGSATFSADNAAAAALLYTLMEHSAPYAAMGNNPWIHGYIAHTDGSASLARIGLGDALQWNPGMASFDVDTGSGWSKNNPHPAIGMWAFRVAEVPEPASITLLGLGAAAIGLSRRRRAGSAR